MLVIGIVVVAVLVTGVLITLDALATLKLANNKLTSQVTTAWRAVGAAEQAVRNAMQSPLLDTTTANVLHLALSDIQQALDSKED